MRVSTREPAAEHLSLLINLPNCANQIIFKKSNKK